MSQENGEVNKGPDKGRRLRVRPLDVGLTLGIIVIAVVVFFAFNRGGSDNEEGVFTKLNPFTGRTALGAGPEVGEAAPDFQVKLSNGETFRLSDQKGKLVWINFWATWCPPCRAEMPDLEEVWEEQQGIDLVLLAVNYAESSQTVQDFIDKLGVTFPVGLDSTGQITTNYRVAGFPSHFFIDRDGIMREIWVGTMNQSTMREKLEDLEGY